MLKTHYGPRTVDEAMIDYLNAHEDYDDQIVNQGESLRRFGRRLLYTSDFGREEYVRCATVDAALAEFEARSFPDEYDAMISEDGRSGYWVSIEGVRVEGPERGAFATREDAEFALAHEMVTSGCFPGAWFIGERGNYWRIDEEIRAYHDEGGDKMHPRYQYADAMFRPYVEAMLWSTTDTSVEDEDSDASFSDNGWTVDDLSDDLERATRDDIRSFVDANWSDLQDMDPSQAGHDLWLTRERHGAGFWDRGLGERGERLTKAAHALGELDICVYYGQVSI